MKEKFKTLFSVKSSLVSLYLAFTLPIPFISREDLKILSTMLFLFGLVLIIEITSDYVEICDEQISYKTSIISNIFGKKTWKILWKDIFSIKSFPTSQGSKVFYFITKNNNNFLIPQRIENFIKFKSIISKKTNIDVDSLSYISPLWTYKLLTLLSFLMIIGEVIAFAT